jgi:hypothetical protein
MRGSTGLRVATLLLLATACCAGESAGFIPTTQGPQFMLYVAKPLGTRGAPKSYGLRIDQASALPPPTGAYQLRSVHRRELVDVKFGPQIRPQVEFGRRLTWELGAQH